MDSSCRWETRTISLTCHSQWKAQKKQISLHGLQKFSFEERFPPTLLLALTPGQPQNVCDTSEAKDNLAALLIKWKETLSSSLARALLSFSPFSHEWAHGGCIHSPGLASQSLSGLQCCSIFRMALNTMVQLHDTVKISQPANPLLFHKHSTSILQ